MKQLATICFWAGLLSILAALILFAGFKLRDWGLFVGLWPATLLILSSIFEQKSKERK
jgi:hypothetical protein